VHTLFFYCQTNFILQLVNFILAQLCYTKLKYIHYEKYLQLVNIFLTLASIQHKMRHTMNVNMCGVHVYRAQQMHQGSPVSPQVYTTMLHKQLHGRGHTFVAYTDDCYGHVKIILNILHDRDLTFHPNTRKNRVTSVLSCTQMVHTTPPSTHWIHTQENIWFTWPCTLTSQPQTNSILSSRIGNLIHQIIIYCYSIEAVKCVAMAHPIIKYSTRLAIVIGVMWETS